MILRSHNHSFLRHITEHSALEIYHRRLLGIAATRKAAAVSDSAIARKFELDRSTVARYIAQPETGGDDGRLIRAMVDGRDNLLATAKRHTLQALADDYGVPISVILAASKPDIWSE